MLIDLFEYQLWIRDVFYWKLSLFHIPCNQSNEKFQIRNNEQPTHKVVLYLNSKPNIQKKISKNIRRSTYKVKQKPKGNDNNPQNNCHHIFLLLSIPSSLVWSHFPPHITQKNWPKYPSIFLAFLFLCFVCLIYYSKKLILVLRLPEVEGFDTKIYRYL